MEKKQLKELLPPGSYEKIAEEIGLSRNTVSQFFAKSGVRISEKTEEKILQAAMKIVEENAWRGLGLLHGELKTEEMKANLAA